MPDINDLSDRERQILNLVATGASNKQIADQLFISTNTVKVHLRKIFSKIEVTSRTEAALFAVKAGLVEATLVKEETGSPVLEVPEVVPFDEPEIQPALTRTDKFRLWVKSHWELSIALVASVVLLSVVGILAARANQPNPAETATSNQASLESRWQEKAWLPISRKSLAVAAYEDYIYAIGGETDQAITGEVERYDPSNDQWISASPKPEPVAEASAAVIGGEIFVPGGKTTGGAPSKHLEIYNPRQDSWRRGADLPMGLSGYALATYEGKLFLFGGWDGQKVLDSVYGYNPDSDTWAQLTAMPSARAYAGAANTGEKIFVVGGQGVSGPLDINEAYQPDLEGSGENPWVERMSMPAPISTMGVASIGNVVHVLGGISPGGQAFPAFEYLPQKDEWLPLESPIAQQWSGFGLVPLETKLYLIGGVQAGQLTNLNMSYQAIYTVVLPIR